MKSKPKDKDTMTKQAEIKPACELATFGSGCFWCTEAIFLNVEGVVKVEFWLLRRQGKEPHLQGKYAAG